MQTLQFETAWNKTISPQDRLLIMKIFEHTKKQSDQGVIISYLWKARNHKGDLLITALIHNYESEPIQLTNTSIAYIERQQNVASGMFNVRSLIAPKTTMPWTFIFSKGNTTEEPPKFSINNSHQKG